MKAQIVSAVEGEAERMLYSAFPKTQIGKYTRMGQSCP